MLTREMDSKNKVRKLLCYVGLPDSSVIEVDFDSKAIGLEIHDKVCSRLKIIETDYFGLMHHNCKTGDELWLNLRNPLYQELCGKQPFRVDFRVKFFVPSYMIQQDSTRHQFYLNIRQSFISGLLHMSELDDVAFVAALILHIESDENRPTDDILTESSQLYDYLPEDVHNTEMLSMVSKEFTKLQNVSTTAAKCRVLAAVDGLPLYGACFHRAVNSFGALLNIAVTPTGVILFNSNWNQIRNVSYVAIQRVTNDGSNLLLDILSDNGTTLMERWKLSSRTAANALYRVMTEKYYFFHCVTVGDTVRQQSNRDLKGVIASLFNEHSALGRSYVFDLQRTMQESYDKARRSLYESTKLAASSSPDVSKPSTSLTEVSSKSQLSCHKCSELKESLESMRDSMRCQICVEQDTNVAFVPCGHVICCYVCSARLQSCPLCQSAIEQRLKIYLPYASDTLASDIH